MPPRRSRSRVALFFRAIFSVVLGLLVTAEVPAADPPNAASLVRISRGPYLQSCSSTGIVICWRTDVPTQGRVLYGEDPTDLDQLATDAGGSENHAISITGLRPNTRYHYVVGTAAQILASGPGFTFNTAPTNAQPTRVWAIGDSGKANTNQAAVRSVFEDMQGDGFANVWLMLGDNAYECGTDAEYQAAVFDMYPSILRRVVLWPTIGNHDSDCHPDPNAFPYLDIFHLPARGEAGGVPSSTEKYYSFDHGNIHFVCLESSPRVGLDAMLGWLERDLAATSKDWIIAYFHHPPYTFGTHDSDSELDLIELRQLILPILESHGVDLVLSGHSHVYERSYLLNGHYGFSQNFTEDHVLDARSGREGADGPYEKPAGGIGANQGTVYVVCGFSGEGGAFNVRPHPAIRTALDGFGSLILDIDGLKLRARLLMASGEIADDFTVQKGLPPADLRPQLTLQRNGHTATLRWPTSLRPFRLESSERPGSAAWHRVPQSPVQIGREETVIIDLLRTNEIFRLRSE